MTWFFNFIIKIVIFVSNLIEKWKMEKNLTPSFSQDSIANSQTTRSKIDLAWEHVSEEIIQMEGKLLFVYIVKRLQKVGVFIK